jgi:hypothetical protein
MLRIGIVRHSILNFDNDPDPDPITTHAQKTEKAFDLLYICAVYCTWF